MLAFSDGCCPKIDYQHGKKEQGTFILQSEKINGNCHYVLEEYGLWMCEDSWWGGELSFKGQCKGIAQASTDSKPNVHVQDDSLQWRNADDVSDLALNFNCVDLCL